MKNLTTTCLECGGEHLPESKPTGVVLVGAAREAALVRELHFTEEQASRATCRVRELEQVVRAFLKGSVKAEVLRAVVEAAA